MVNLTRELSSAASPAAQPPHRPIRADTLDLKQKLAVALGQNGARYWQTLMQFLKGAIDRSEFEALAHKALKTEHIHLHNALILGILYNASADVPGPSSRAARRITRLLPDGTTVTEEEEEEPSRKRLRNLVAGLPRKERLRLKNLEKAGKLGANAVGGAASLGWAGAAADMLEKKRKDEEKRKVADDRRKVRQYKSAIGAKDWKGQAIQATQQIAAVRTKLSFSAQQAVMRAMQAPLCVESKHLPDLDGIKDRMTLLAVENGMPGGVQPQAAAMVLSALQSHLQNVASSIITKIRANRTDGIRTNQPLRPAAEYSNISLDPAAYMPAPLPASPALDEMDVDDSAPNSAHGSPARHVRSIQSDMSRTSTSGIGTSFADSSMLSLASTAPTSLTGPSSPSIRDGDSSGQLHDTSFGNSSTSADAEDADGVDAGRSSRLKRSREAMEGGAERSDAVSTRLTVSDVAFLLEVAPHTVVEPMGQGTQERMLAPEWSDDLGFGDDDGRLRASSPDRQLARAARLAATTHLSDTAAAQGSDAPVRNRFIIDQSAPLRLLDRRSLAENEGRLRPTKGGLSVPEYKDSAVLADVNGRKKDVLHGGVAGTGAHRHKDDIWDVVDPVALFGQLCE
ncbi:related to HFI1-adaptor protein required for structural integrity of the SAGA complex [Sporisorium reilianum f. sp. reilianum]|uniref:Related to HFI1-adaptor protein required for structural integrity of the SAGA complex n=1 Tax=Sporisorium reilianum f. sp. reilianum TaxID=72559 RepID=A0A2N8UHZ3_9BASI|nr:related to HFI1-adaptor protein required for structural integrity of the SAGA complex [Sporisorium reilianum f. sp. reilianum]